jgi:hypothetical protein
VFMNMSISNVGETLGSTNRSIVFITQINFNVDMQNHGKINFPILTQKTLKHVIVGENISFGSISNDLPANGRIH